MMKEPEIKLFGRMILLPESGGDVAGGEFSGESSDGSNNGSSGGVDCDRCSEGSEVKQEEKQDQGDDEDKETGEMSETTEQDEEQKPEKSNNTTLSESDNNPRTTSVEEDDDVASPNQNEQQTDNTPQNGQQQQQKTLKKPDKILPCPRCNSMDTKFCYYNNYNVNQPRHFCKSCQRYWTAGGTMRNVPVGAGRRKNKNTGSHCRHITISEALQAARIDPPPNGFNHMKFKPNGTVLSFGPDSSPLCESMASALNLSEKRATESRNGFYKMEHGSDNNGDGQKIAIQNAQNGLPPPIACMPGVPWSFPWNPALPVPAIYPMPYYPTPYAWNMPWVTVPFPSPNQKANESNPGSPLGKHSRNGELIASNRSEDQEEPKNADNSIVVPKTLRIDDPEEAAKSSIWTTLGIKYGSINREGLFKALQPKDDVKKQMVNTSPLLQANPAALSRSISFQERA